MKSFTEIKNQEPTEPRQQLKRLWKFFENVKPWKMHMSRPIKHCNRMLPHGLFPPIVISECFLQEKKVSRSTGNLSWRQPCIWKNGCFCNFKELYLAGFLQSWFYYNKHKLQEPEKYCIWFRSNANRWFVLRGHTRWEVQRERVLHDVYSLILQQRQRTKITPEALCDGKYHVDECNMMAFLLNLVKQALLLVFKFWRSQYRDPNLNQNQWRKLCIIQCIDRVWGLESESESVSIGGNEPIDLT